MAMHVIANSPDCQGGNCPTIWQDPDTGRVRLRGYDPADPTRELDIEWSGGEFSYLLSQLPK